MRISSSMLIFQISTLIYPGNSGKKENLDSLASVLAAKTRGVELEAISRGLDLTVELQAADL